MELEVTDQPVEHLDEICRKSRTSHFSMFLYKAVIDDFLGGILRQDYIRYFTTFLKEVQVKAVWAIVLRVVKTDRYCVNVQLRLVSMTNSDSLETCSLFSIVDGKGERRYNAQLLMTVFDSTKNLSIDFDFLPMEDLANPAKKLIFKQRLSFTCEINVKSGERMLKGSFVTKQLSEDLGAVLNDGTFSDVVLSAGGRHFPCHRIVLAARSPVFRTMFQVKMLEKEADIIELADIEPEVLEEMLKFVYTDQVSNPVRSGIKLLEAADRFGLVLLFHLCEAQIELTAENSTSILAITDQHNADHLKERTLDFISKNIRL